MNIDKAIEILTLSTKGINLVSHKDLMESVNLGIEALKTIKDMRHYPFPDGVVQLPGETKD